MRIVEKEYFKKYYEKITIQIYFDYYMNELELVVFVGDDLDLILKEYVLEATNMLKSYKAIRISDNVEYKVYNSFIVPMFKF